MHIPKVPYKTPDRLSFIGRLLGRRIVTRLLDTGSSPTDFANLSITVMIKRPGMNNWKLKEKLAMVYNTGSALLPLAIWCIVV